MKISSHPLIMVVALLYLIGLSTIHPLRYSASADNPYPPPVTPASFTPSYKSYLPIIIQPPSVSRYIKPSSTPPYLDPNQFYNLGKAYVMVNGVVIFHFGQPCFYNDEGVPVYGASAYREGCRGTPEIKAAVQEFIHGYCVYRHGCNTISPKPSLYLAIATSNCTNGGDQCTNPDQGTNVTYAHGQAWSQLISDLTSYITNQGYSYQVFVAGAIDAELSWDTPVHTRNWVNGYKQGNYNHLYNIGACDGCPGDYTPNPPLTNGWSYEDIWYISHGASVIYSPVPEIYKTNGINAEQWQAVSYYAATEKSGKLPFRGVLTQYQACADTNFTACENIGTINLSNQAWHQLWDALYQDPLTRLTSLDWQTDISWRQEP